MRQPLALGRLGRWLCPDPVPRIGSPYVGLGNNPISFSDPDGRDIIVLNYTSGAGGAGHVALLVQNPDKPGGWKLYSKNGTNWFLGYSGPNPKNSHDHKAPQDGVPYASLKNFYDANAGFGEGASQYDRALYIKTTPAEDEAVMKNASAILKQPYHVLDSSCQTTVQEALRPLHIGFFYGSGMEGYNLPNTNFEELEAQLERLNDPVFRTSFWAVGFGRYHAFENVSSIIRYGIQSALLLRGVTLRRALIKAPINPRHNPMFRTN